MDNLIEVRNLNKRYMGFELKDVNLTVPTGCIVGLIGQNGAGKTSTIKAIMNVIKPDSGTIRLMGKDPSDASSRADVGVVFEDSYFHEGLTSSQIGKIMQNICPVWDMEKFHSLNRRFSIDDKKPVKDFSRGMRMKLSIITALSRNPKLLVLDEPTSGLDPVVRGEILDIFLEFIQDESRAILVSSHITADLEKVADSIAWIDDGKLVFQKDKDALMEDMAIVRCNSSKLDILPESYILARKTGTFGTSALVQHPKEVRRLLPEAVIDRATIDDMMQFYAGRNEQ